MARKADNWLRGRDGHILLPGEKVDDGRWIDVLLFMAVVVFLTWVLSSWEL
ncbi:MAG: hypothetical protein PHI12_10935 [Dehalococcoidales bacterium]|nr:hypothetical protein [Dehalococcoidales bacterium]